MRASDFIIRNCLREDDVYVPMDWLEPKEKILLQKKILVKSDHERSEIECPCGCGTLVRIEDGGRGRKIAVCPDDGTIYDLEKRQYGYYKVDKSRVHPFYLQSGFAGLSSAVPPGLGAPLSPVAPKRKKVADRREHLSKWRGKSIDKGNSRYVEIGKDGHTFTTLRMDHGKLRRASYYMTSPQQLLVMDALLDGYDIDAAQYVPPPVGLPRQNTSGTPNYGAIFNRNSKSCSEGTLGAADFYNDGHIEVDSHGEHGLRGGIRLRIP